MELVNKTVGCLSIEACWPMWFFSPFSPLSFIHQNPTPTTTTRRQVLQFVLRQCAKSRDSF